MSDPSTTRVISTDFGATLSLYPLETDNCHENRHVVVDIFVVHYDWRKVTINNDLETWNGKEEDLYDERIVSTCDKWVFFMDTLSKGKKNDYVTHNANLLHIIEYYDKINEENGNQRLKNNVIHSDQAPTQYKCNKNFIKIATFSREHNNSRIIHKYAQKYFFKGSWDSFSKTVKDNIMGLETRYERVDEALKCYLLLSPKSQGKQRKVTFSIITK